MHLFSGKDVPAAEKMSRTMQEELQAAKACMQKAQDRQEAYANDKRRAVTFEVGQYVFLNSKNMKLRGKGTPKLIAQVCGTIQN